MSDSQRKLLKALIVGKPNVGKSTLLNSLVGEKVSIVSRKAQTTQRNTTGVITKDNSQLIFFDTPGLNKIEKNIRISETFKTVAENVDVLIYMVDNTKKSQSIDDQFRNWLNNNENKFIKKILIITKKINSVINFDETFFISLSKKSGLERLFNWVEKQAYTNEWVFQQTHKSNISKKNFLSELTREKVFEYIHEEIPYNLEINTDYIEPSRNKSLKVYQTVWLNKKSHKPIILGKEGKSIKMISVQARLDMQKFLKSKLHLFIRLKMKKSV